MQLIRSLIFQIAFYVTTLIQMIVYSPFYFIGDRKKKWWVPKTWSRVNMWLAKHILGLRLDVEGAENMPETGYILALKHQSSIDTYCFLPWVRDPVLILKRVLMYVPIFGWYVARMKMIPIDRGNRESAIRKVNEGARQALAEGRELLIYPEGTRRAPGAEPAYKSGIAHLYTTLNVPVVIIAHNAGLFGPKNSIMRYGGTLKARILPPIQPGLSRQAFMKELVTQTEAACDELLLETAQMPDCPPLPGTARRRIAELKVTGIDETN